MNDYAQVTNKAELALNNGKYENCVEIIKPIVETFSVSSKEGINLRMMLITAYSGLNKNDEALAICKQLAKSRSSQVRENAKSLIQILNAPNLKTPDNWNIKLETNFKNRNQNNDSRNKTKKFNQKETYIKFLEEPTGETKPLKKGFAIFTIAIFISLIMLLSGCVNIKNKLDLRDLNSINMNLEINSKYIKKIPWQINFEKKMIENFSSKNIFSDQEEFSIEEKGINLDEAIDKLNKIIKIASETTLINFEDIEINHSERDYFFAKKHFFSFFLNLESLNDIDNLDISMNIVNESKPIIIDQNKNTTIIQNDINWQLTPGKKNQIKFTYWNWNKLFLSFTLSILIVITAYLIKKSRYELGSNLPELPS